MSLFAGHHDHRLLIRILRDLRVIAAIAGAFEAIAHVGAHRLEVTHAAEFLLDHVLHVLDVDEGLLADAHALGDRLGDIDRGFGGFAHREKRLAHGDFDFRFRPRHHIAVAADEAHRHRLRRGVDIDIATALVGAAERE